MKFSSIEDGALPEIIIKEGHGKHVKEEDNSSKPSSPDGNESPLVKEDEQLHSAKTKIGEVREENERLKLLLAKITNDYKSLQMQFFEILKQESRKSSDPSLGICEDNAEPNELVSLSLGRSSSTESNKDEKKSCKSDKGKDDMSLINGGLELGLECRSNPGSIHESLKRSSSDSFENLKEEEAIKIWPPSKVLKTMKGGDEEEASQQTQKKPRVLVRARCDSHTMNDGCQWRKYGQKIAKGNPCPRAYYRCTGSPTCPVRKQVQRCAQDMSILITTYEGTHNHPLALSATAMASTTAAAASMLQSQSSTSKPGLGTSVSAPIAASTSHLQGLNFTFSQNARQSSHQYYFTNSTISTSNSHPTITLDLTTPNSSLFNSFFSAPRYSSACINFSSPSNSNSFDKNTLQKPWTNEYPRNAIGSLNLQRQTPQEHFSQPNYIPINTQNTLSHQQALQETIVAATKVIASNLSFRSALASAITSYANNGNSNNSSTGSGLNMRWGEPFPVSLLSAQNEIVCASGFLNTLSSLNPQEQGPGLSLFQSSIPLSLSKSCSGSPVDTRDSIK